LKFGGGAQAVANGQAQGNGQPALRQSAGAATTAGDWCWYLLHAANLVCSPFDFCFNFQVYLFMK
jgi:hypothetical protein